MAEGQRACDVTTGSLDALTLSAEASPLLQLGWRLQTLVRSTSMVSWAGMTACACNCNCRQVLRLWPCLLPYHQNISVHKDVPK